MFSSYLQTSFIDDGLGQFLLFLFCKQLHQLNLLFQLSFFFQALRKKLKLKLKSQLCQVCIIRISLMLELLLLRLEPTQKLTGTVKFLSFLLWDQFSWLDSKGFVFFFFWDFWFGFSKFICFWFRIEKFFFFFFAVSIYQSCWQNIRSLDLFCKCFLYAAVFWIKVCSCFWIYVFL